MKREINLRLLLIALLYAVFILLFLSKFNFNPSATIELSENYIFTYGGEIPSGIVVHKNDGFDGQFYYMMALNPSLDKIFLQPHFFQRILYPVLALILSLGIKELLPITLILINYVAIILSCYILMLILRKYKANLNLVFIFAFNVGLIISITRNLTEPLMTLLIICAIYFLDKKRHVISMIFFSFALLAREIALPLYVALLLYFFIKLDFKKLGLYSFALIPFLIWEYILFLKTGIIPLFLSFNSISRPFLGLINYLFNVSHNLDIYLIEPSFQEFLISKETLGEIYKIFSPFPIILIALFQLLTLFIVFLKNKKITTHLLFLLSQTTMILMLNRGFFFKEEIGGVGRYAILMMLISIIFYAKEKNNYGIFLRFLLIISFILSIFISVIFMIQRLIFFNTSYYII